MSGSAVVVAMPRISDTLFMTGEPPTGQNSPSRLSLSTQADAKAAQPGKPQPPQLACGSTSLTSPMRGSSWTSNFLETTKSNIELTRPSSNNTIIVVVMENNISYSALVISNWTRRLR